MCTAITLQSSQGENFFGRTMDFSYPIDPGVYIIPRNFHWKSLATMNVFTDQYAIIALGQETDGMLAFFDGVNEQGFAAATLYFEGYADYDLPLHDKLPVASIDFLHFMLGRCRTIDDVKMLVKNISIVGVPDPVTNRSAPLHWIATDKSGRSIVIEQTKNGLEVFDNPIGVMANSPNFQWHMTNLRNYMGIETTQKAEVMWDNVSLKPFSQGAGSRLLPGGFTSPERFVRASFLKTHVPTPKSEQEAINTGFHVLNGVFIPKGVVVTDRGVDDYTKYVAFINTKTSQYYFKSYKNQKIFKVNLNDYLNETELIFLGSIIPPYDIV